MQSVVHILKAVYYFGIAPYLLGLIVSRFAKSGERSILKTYVSGYIGYFSLFGFLSYTLVNGVLFKGENALFLLVNIWKWMILILPVFAIAVTAIGKDARSGFVQELKGVLKTKKSTRLLALVLVFVTAASVLLIVPAKADTTPELVLLTQKFDEVFTFDPLTGAEIVYDGGNYPLIHLFYYVGSAFSGVQAAGLIHTIVPVFLLLLFYGIYAALAKSLFSDRPDGAFWFFAIAVTVFAVIAPCSIYTGIGVFQNIWNGETLAVSCFLPYLIVKMTELLRALKRGDGEEKKALSITRIVLTFFEMLLCLQLCTAHGGTFALCALLLAAAVA